jgi:hypothetical protein
LDQLRAERLAELAAARYQHECGGTTWDDLPVATCRDSQGKASGLFLSVLSGVRADGAVWKFADGVARALTNTQAQALATAIALHVQACFEREAELASVISASEKPWAVDISTGWPSTTPPVVTLGSAQALTEPPSGSALVVADKKDTLFALAATL